MSEIKENEEGIFDGCFYVWVDVTKKYMEGKNVKSIFNNYEKLKENSK
ncbi:hypothetical protein [Caldiplasma sukawensis]